MIPQSGGTIRAVIGSLCHDGVWPFFELNIIKYKNKELSEVSQEVRLGNSQTEGKNKVSWR